MATTSSNNPESSQNSMGKVNQSIGSWLRRTSENIRTTINNINGTNSTREYNERMQAQQNAYNTPNAQMQRLMAAGFTYKQAQEAILGAGSSAFGNQQTAVSDTNTGGGALGAIDSIAGAGSSVASAFGASQQGIGQMIDNQYKDILNQQNFQQITSQIHKTQTETDVLKWSKTWDETFNRLALSGASMQNLCDFAEAQLAFEMLTCSPEWQ